MPVNRYTSLNWNSPISMYTPMPFDAMNEVGRQSQDRYNKGKALSDDSLGALNNIQAASFDQGAKSELVNKYNGAINDLIEKHKHNYGSPEFKTDVSRLMSNAKNDTEVQRLAHNKKYEDEVLTPYSKSEKSQENINHFKTDPKFKDNSNKEWMTEIPYTPYANATDRYKDYFDGIKEQSHEVSKADFDSKSMGDGKYFIDEEHKYRYIKPDQLQRITHANFDSFLNTKEAQYEFHKNLQNNGYSPALQQLGVDVSKLTPHNSEQILSSIPTKNGISNAYKDIHEQMYNNMNAYGQKYLFSSTENKEHAREDQVGTKKKEEQGAVPVYSTPSQQVKGIDLGDAFTMKSKGSRIPYSPNEIDEIYHKYKSVKDGDEVATQIIANGKGVRKTNEYDNIQTLSKDQKEFMLSALQTLDKDVYNKVKNGSDLSPEEKSKLYPQLKIIGDIAKQDLKTNSTSIGLTPKEAQNTNLDLFGNKAEGNHTVNELGTGQAGNVKFYDKEEGKVISLQELKEKYSDKEPVSVRGKLTADHPYTFVTGDNEFASPKQLFIGGKEYIVSGPKEYIDPDTKSNKIPENAELHRTKVANDIYNTKFSVIPQEKSIYGVKTIIGFKPDDINDRSKGVFSVTIHGDHHEFSTAQEAEDFILNQVK